HRYRAGWTDANAGRDSFRPRSLVQPDLIQRGQSRAPNHVQRRSPSHRPPNKVMAAAVSLHRMLPRLCLGRDLPAGRDAGPQLTVSGLLTARDVIANRKRLAGEAVILPRVMLDKTGTRLLDNVTPKELESTLGMPVRFAGMMSEVEDMAASSRWLVPE